MTMNSQSKITVAICESQPLVVAGLQALLRDHPVYEVLEPARSLDEVGRIAVGQSPRVVILDKALGAPAVSDFLSRYRERVSCAFVVWGPLMTEPEALRFLKVGASGIVRKTSEISTVLACIEAVAGGGTWMEDSLFHSGKRDAGNSRSDLTIREQQVLELVEQGLRNKDIARELGIQPGTVKIHLKHIFEKTGVRGRYGLALTGLQQRAIPPMMHV